MLFNFGESDPEYGYMQGKELQTTLQQVLHDFPVVVRTGKGYVEACLKDVNKGAMCVLPRALNSRAPTGIAVPAGTAPSHRLSTLPKMISSVIGCCFCMRMSLHARISFC